MTETRQKISQEQDRLVCSDNTEVQSPADWKVVSYDMLLSLSPIALRVASLPRILCISSIYKQNDYTQLFSHSIIESLSYLFRTMLVSVIASRTRREIAPNFTECIHSSSHSTHSTKHHSRCLGHGSEQNKDPQLTIDV